MDQDDTILAYVQGRLSSPQQEAFEAELAHDPKLAAEVAALRNARTILGETPEDLPVRGWERLSAAIERDARPTPANDNRAVRLTLLQAACVAVVSVIGWQALQATVFTPQPTGFAPASAPVDAPCLQVIFAAGADFADVTQLLVELEGMIIDGPSAVGLYLIKFPDEATRDAALGVLRSRPDIASSVSVE